MGVRNRPGKSERRHTMDEMNERVARLEQDNRRLQQAVKGLLVRERQRGHLVFVGLLDQVAEAVRPVEEGVFGMRVEVDEAHRACGSLAWRAGVGTGVQRSRGAGRVPAHRSHPEGSDIPS